MAGFIDLKNKRLFYEAVAHELQTLWILAIGFAIACGAGYFAEKLKLPSILGYLIAGFLIGPNSPGIVVDPAVTDQLAMIGVTLLMFVVGLNFSFDDLSKVKHLALPGAVALSFLSILAGTLLGIYEEGSILSGFVIGLAICVSSTVVIVRSLTDQNLIHTKEGHLVIGWTLVEDLISVFGLILLPALVVSKQGDFLIPLLQSIGLVVMKVILLGLFIYMIGSQILEKLLKTVARTRSHELFTLAILASVFTIAIGSSYIFGVSLALGAFIAGTVVGKTALSHQAAANALPMRDAFAVIFFLSVGMLFNPPTIFKNLPFFLLLLLIVMCIRPLAAYLFAKAARLSSYQATILAFSIAQIGEYSFILAEEGNRLHILPDAAYDLIVATAFVSIGLSPLLLKLFSPRSKEDKKESKEEQEIPHSFLPKALVVGYGKVGRAAADELAPFYNVVIVDRNIDTVIEHIGASILLFGDATQRVLLERAGALNAQIAIITTPDWRINREIITSFQELNPYAKVITRAHMIRDKEHLSDFDIPIICDEEEAAEKMRHVVKSILN